MSWLSDGLKGLRRGIGLPPITLGSVLKGTAVAVVGEKVSPTAASGLRAVLDGGWDGIKSFAQQLGGSLHVSADPVSNRVSVSTAATLPNGAVTQGTSVGDVLTGRAAGGLAALPWYYFAGAAVLLWLVVRGLSK